MTSFSDLIFVLPVVEWLLDSEEDEQHVAMLCRRRCVKKVDNVEEEEEHAQVSFLDLPELALEGILRRLPAAALCRMAAVCRELRKRCRSNHLWETLVNHKWGKVAGKLAFSEWELRFMADRQHAAAVSSPCRSSPLWIWPLSCIFPVSWLRNCSCRRSKSSLTGAPGDGNSSSDTFMALYWDLESGRFRFPAQVYNRENGHVGFMLSCYDAEMSYNSATDSFLASFSYPPHGPRTSVYEEDVPWERVRPPPVTTTAHELHVSDCLHELRPGDHIEVQWRRNKDFPYGWWYGAVGHEESCTRSSLLCQCHVNKTVWLEFNQYSNGSRWRRAPINRENHCEEGNDAEGYYGGLRKLRKDEISIWTKLWPNEKLE